MANGSHDQNASGQQKKYVNDREGNGRYGVWATFACRRCTENASGRPSGPGSFQGATSVEKTMAVLPGGTVNGPRRTGSDRSGNNVKRSAVAGLFATATVTDRATTERRWKSSVTERGPALGFSSESVARPEAHRQVSRPACSGTSHPAS